VTRILAWLLCRLLFKAAPAVAKSEALTVVVMHSAAYEHPLIFNLPGVWKDDALLVRLEPLLEEHLSDALDDTIEIMWWADGKEVDSAELHLEFG